MVNVYATILAKTQENIPTAIGKGATILVSPFTYLYLDRPYTDSADEATDQDRAKRLGQPAYPPGTLQACAELRSHPAGERQSSRPTAQKVSRRACFTA